MENIPSGMLSFTAEGQVLTANNSALEILGKSAPSEINWYRIFPETERAADNFRGDLKYVESDDQAAKILGVTLSKVYSPDLQAPLSIALIDDLTKVRQLEFAARQNENLRLWVVWQRVLLMKFAIRWRVSVAVSRC
jgi:two-component system sensor histidine kinase PilS (NtrC family)